MPEYIDRDLVLAFMRGIYCDKCDNYNGVRCRACEFDDALTYVEDFPAEDVVPVVRCKDCVWFGRLGCAVGIVNDADRPKENDFCSFGERKDGDTL